MKTPRKASASDHSISCHQGNTMGPPAGFCCLFIMPSAGTMPTSPAVQRCQGMACNLRVNKDIRRHSPWTSLGPSPHLRGKGLHYGYDYGNVSLSKHLPAAKGIVAVATEVVCRITFSPMLRPEVIP